MSSDALEAARSRYRAAYALYQECAQRVTQKLEAGSIPTAEEIAAEAAATEALSRVRRELLDAMGDELLPPS